MALSGLGLDQRGTDTHPREPTPILLQRADKMFASPDWVYEKEQERIDRENLRRVGLPPKPENPGDGE